MKFSLMLAAAGALTTSVALAQTVAPGTTPGSQTGNPSSMPSAGHNTDPISNPDRMDHTSSTRTTGSSKGMTRKGGKMKTGADGTMKTKTKM